MVGLSKKKHKMVGVCYNVFQARDQLEL